MWQLSHAGASVATILTSASNDWFDRAEWGSNFRTGLQSKIESDYLEANPPTYM